MAAKGAVLETLMRAAMDARGLSVSQLAREAKVRRELIYQWWRGEQKPTRSSLARVAEPLGLDLGELMGVYEMASEADEALIQVLIDEQRATREMLSQVLSALSGTARDPEMEAWMARVDERLSLLPTDADPDTQDGSSQDLPARPTKRRGGNG